MKDCWKESMLDSAMGTLTGIELEILMESMLDSRTETLTGIQLVISMEIQLDYCLVKYLAKHLESKSDS